MNEFFSIIVSSMLMEIIMSILSTGWTYSFFQINPVSTSVRSCSMKDVRENV